MILRFVLLIIGFFCVPIIADGITKMEISLPVGGGIESPELGEDTAEKGKAISLLSSEWFNTSFTWDIPSVNVTNQTDFIQSLVISNLALENGSTLTLTPLANTSSKEVPHVLTISGNGAASLPILYLDLNTHYQLKYDRPVVNNVSKTLLQASRDLITNDACAPIVVTDKQSFKSYNYPNNYPLLDYKVNTQCRNVSSTAANIYVTFIDVDLAEGHHLEFADSTGSINLTKSELKGDAILSNLTVINFLRSFNPDEKTSKNINDKLSGRGFNISLEPLECGGKIDASKKSEHTFNFTTIPEKCIWILSTEKGKDGALNVLNFSLSDGLDNVIIHDSDSRKNNLLVNRTGAEYLNSTSETIIIEFTSSNKSAATLKWSTITCPDACLSVRRCINPSQRCNGVNDCGDWSDEIHCNGSTPIPQPKPAPSGGVPGLVVIFVIMPISLILGILGTIFVPRIVARIRGGHYQEFREGYPDVA